MKKFFAGLLAIVCCLSSFGCFGLGDKSNDLTVYMPDGAPALAFAKLMHEDTEDDGFEYKVVSPTVIKTKVTYKDDSKNADLCVLPVTAASKLLGDGRRYQMLGAVTHGNLYLVAKTDGERLSYTSQNLTQLVGKTVGVLQINEVPGLTLKAVLNTYALPWQEVSEGQEKAADKVNLVGITGADAVGVVAADCFLIAEPAATAQSKKGYSIVGDMQALYGGDGYTQAVLVAKTSLTADAAWVNTVTAQLKNSVEWLKTATGEQIVSAVSAHIEDEGTTTSLKAPLLSAEVVARCGVRFVGAAACKARTEDFLRALLGVNDKAAALPNAVFYYTE